MLEIYNSLSRKTQTFKPIEKYRVKMYNCGPTVYDFAHIGNLRTFSMQDFFRKYLEFKGFEVFCIMNITDVDDKTIRGAAAKGVSLKEYTQKYFAEFVSDLKSLGIKWPTKFVFATDNVSEMILLVKKLLEKGIAYKSSDGSIYYSIKKFKKYGALSKLKISKLKAGARVSSDEYKKTSASDFVLWKAWQPSDGEVFWETNIGKGRPGWHLECSAMSMKYLGETFDVHGGGVDLIFPHHENEIAQSEGVTGKKFVNFWVHYAHLIVDGKKMSKSLGNFYTLRDLKEFDPRAIRFEFLKAHYRDKLNFSINSLRQAQTVIEGFDEFTRKLLSAKGNTSQKIGTLIKEMGLSFETFLDNDLDTPKMFARLFGFVKKINGFLGENNLSQENAQEVIVFLEKINSVLGLFMFEFDSQIGKELLDLIKERELARKQKNFSRSDELRKILLEKGIALDDTLNGVKWKKVK